MLAGLRRLYGERRTHATAEQHHRTGIISEVDEESWCVRVRSGNWKQAGCAGTPRARVPSMCVAAITRRTGGNCLHRRQPGNAMIIGSLWSDAIPAPGKSLKKSWSARRMARCSATTRTQAPERQRHENSHPAGIRQRDTGTPVVECTNHLKTATIDVTDGEA